jgi:GGDEF domain-containing protein
LPLFSDARVEDAGVIEIHSDAALAPEVLQLIDQLCRIYRNIYTVLEYSDRDALTGLLNRKSLDDAFYSAVLEALDGQLVADGSVSELGAERRHRVPANYWLGAARIDQYDAILLQHGLTVAEEVMQRVARVARNTFRTYDRLYHFASEHFGVLMHCPDEALVLSAFERFRVGVEQANFGVAGRVTLSCGFTTVQADDTPASALEKTERALQFSQRSGRNRVCSYPGLERRGVFDSAASEPV